MACAESLPTIPMEILVKESVFMGRLIPKDGVFPRFIWEENPNEPFGEFCRDIPKIEEVAGSGREFNFQFIAIVVMESLQG